MTAPQYDDLLELATRLACESGELVRGKLGQIAVYIKPDTSVVTDTDHRIQDQIVRTIRQQHPDHAIVAEEGAEGDAALPHPARAEFCWVIDPLDGTRNFTAGLPCFCTSIGILRQGLPVVGVVVEHNLGIVYRAAVGAGAMCNGRAIAVRELPPELDRLVGIPSGKDWVSLRVIQAWCGIENLAFRNLGSTAWHLALVASGALQATFMQRCKIWDLAAGVLLVQEAGGVVSDARGATLLPFDLARDMQDDLPCLAGTPPTHAALLPTVRRTCGD
ncbi:MAG TPA: inositol monophosphatase [Phycisphaerae bacterium]|nr:inositol monophosphatase [Phycisphaerae bacterium]HNU44309.1 inositol monophosphatase [Phycisphaerae bacterium]